jgi:hypothetical protein
MRELAILASHRACMRVVVRRLAAVLLEFPVALQAAHLLASKCRSGLQTARRCCLFIALRPRVRTGRGPNFRSIAIKTKSPPARGELWEVGIGHPGQPPRLHARCRSQARSSAARIPCSPRVRTGRGPNFRSIAIKTKSPPARGELFVLLVETAGIEPASASPLQAVLHT